GKALGVAGAFVAGPSDAIEYLVQRARPFVFSTARPPALAAAIDAALDVVASEPERRERVGALTAFLRRRLCDAGLPPMGGESQIIPVRIGSNAQALAVAARLHADGFDVRAIRPPSVPDGTARLRVPVNALLDEETLDRFVRSLTAIWQEAGLCFAVSS
ncbi:MAG: aminotransferase class I/II-fold pyridoxal phosphate-dependent enzyme, partial [Vicinamibacterales bacterium]